MQAHLDNDMVFDYAMSNNGAVPAEYNNVGLAWALVSHHGALRLRRMLIQLLVDICHDCSG